MFRNFVRYLQDWPRYSLDDVNTRRHLDELRQARSLVILPRPADSGARTNSSERVEQLAMFAAPVAEPLASEKVSASSAATTLAESTRAVATLVESTQPSRALSDGVAVAVQEQDANDADSAAAAHSLQPQRMAKTATSTLAQTWDHGSELLRSWSGNLRDVLESCLEDLTAEQRGRGRHNLRSPVAEVAHVAEALEPRLALAALGEVFDVNQTTAGAQTSSTSAYAGDGSFIVIWAGPHPTLANTSAIIARQYNAAGDPLPANPNEQVLVQSNTATLSSPQVAMDTQGNFALTWVSTTGGVPSIFAQRFDQNAAPREAAFSVAAGGVNPGVVPPNPTDPAISMEPGGQFVIAWEETIAAGDTDIFSQQFPAAPGAPPAPVRETNLASVQRNVSVSMSDPAEFVIAYESDQTTATVFDIFKKQTEAGQNDAVGVAVTASAGVQDTAPSVARDPAGSYVITWLAGSKVNFELYINNVAQGIQVADTGAAAGDTHATPHAAIAAGLLNAVPFFVITWRDTVALTNIDTIEALIVNSSAGIGGAPFPGPFTVTTGGFAPPTFVNDSVAMGADGRFLVTWTLLADTGNIQAKRLDIPFVANALLPILGQAPNQKWLGSSPSILENVAITDTNVFLPYRVTALEDGMMRIRVVMNPTATVPSTPANPFTLFFTDDLLNPFATVNSTTVGSTSENATFVMPVVAGEDYFFTLLRLGLSNGTIQIDLTPAPTPAQVRVSPAVTSPSSSADLLTRHVRPDVLIEVDMADFIAAGIPFLTPAQATPIVPGVNDRGYAVAVFITNISSGVTTKQYANSASATPDKFYKFTPTADLPDGTYNISAAIEIIDRLPVPARGVAPLSQKTVLNVADIDPTKFVEYLYRTILRRDADPASANYINSLRNNLLTDRQVEADIWNSIEHRNQQVDDSYRQIFGRGAADADKQNYGGKLNAGTLTEEGLLQILLDSPEYQGRFNSSSSYVQGLYQTLLGRNADQGGLDAWVAQLDSNTLNESQVAAAFLASDEFRNRAIDSYYQQFLGRQSDAVGRGIYRTHLAGGTFRVEHLARELLTSEELYARF